MLIRYTQSMQQKRVDYTTYGIFTECNFDAPLNHILEQHFIMLLENDLKV